jgi:PAS domain S-box-containing protein
VAAVQTGSAVQAGSAMQIGSAQQTGSVLQTGIIMLLILPVIAVTFLSGCSADHKIIANNMDSIKSYLDIPGVTEEEIAAIEAFKAEGRSFSYGSLKSTEAFELSNGSDAGFSILFRDLLSELFGIPFILEIHEWDAAKSGIDNMSLDFLSDMTPTPERRQIYFMTHSIADRTLSIFTYENNDRFKKEQDVNGLKLGFYGGTITAQSLINTYPALYFEIVDLFSVQEVAESLASGRIDAFVGDTVASAEYEDYPFVHSKVFFPLVYTPVSLTTGNPELKPVISIVDKYIEAGGIYKLYKLYKEGNYEYAKYELSRSFTDAEAAYIAALINNGTKVSIALEYDNYPICFYNTNDKEFQGIVPEILSEITMMTGIEFHVATNDKTLWYEIIEMLNTNEVSFVSQLLYTPERKDKYLWSQPYSTAHFSLISKNNYPHLEMPQVVRARVGVNAGTAYDEMYKLWFPNSSNLVYFDSTIEAMKALERDEIDMVMASENAFITLTNYNEKLGYMINIRFNTMEESCFGFNLNEEILASIIRKSQKYIAAEKISSYWTNRMFDYSRKLVEAQRPLLIGATVLSLLVLLLILAMFYRTRNEGKWLEKIVVQKTSTLTAILDATPDLIFCKDLDLRFTECNKSMETHFNVCKSDIIGKNDVEAFGVSPEIMEQYNAIDKKVFHEKQAVIADEFIPSSDGKMVLFETIKTPLIQDDQVTGLVVMSRDITQRKAAEREARNASEAKTRFIANMSHEMRTPMNVIVGLTDLMLEETDVSGKVKETLKKINTAGNTLMGLINDVLDISKIEAGKLDLVPVQYDVASLLNDIIAFNIIRVEEKPITFKLDIDENLPCILFGDDLRVKQIFNNLLSNAFKYTKKGTITLGISCRSEDGPPLDTLSLIDSLVVSFYVCDTGIGIRAEDMTKLFTDYNQVDTSAHREIEGTGLGLSITKKLVELMGGEITVESEYGKGTTFHVRIKQGFITRKPLGKETVENLSSFRYSDKKKRGYEKLVRPDLSYARVLVVDDIPTNLDVAAGRLRKYKMQVDCVTSGQAAIDLIASGKPVYDAIFMDHMMPILDGIQSTIVIRTLNTEYAKKIPIIALTANAVSGSEQMFLDNGFNAFLPKPFNAILLDSIVQQWVRDARKEAQR